MHARDEPGNRQQLLYGAVDRQQATNANTTWSADVQWQTQPGGNSSGQDAGNPLIINLIIYYVESPRESVIKLHPQFRSTTLPAESDTGI